MLARNGCVYINIFWLHKSRWEICGRCMSVADIANIADLINSFRYEDMAAQMGVVAKKFTQLHQDQVHALQRHMGDYIKDFLHIQNQPVPIGTSTPKHQYILTTPNGYLILLNESFDMKKHELEHVLQNYLSRHYSAYMIIWNLMPIITIYRIGFRTSNTSSALRNIGSRHAQIYPCSVCSR